MKSIAEDSSTRMFNGVQHVWSEHIAVAVEESPPSPTMAQMSNDDLMETVAQEEAMDDIVVNDESEDWGDDDITENETLADRGNIPKYSVDNAWKDGNDIMKKKNYVALKKATEARNDRKRLVAKFILRKVKELG